MNIAYTIPTVDETRQKVRDHKNLNESIREIIGKIDAECDKGRYYTVYSSDNLDLLYQIKRVFIQKGYNTSLKPFTSNIPTHELTISWKDY